MNIRSAHVGFTVSLLGSMIVALLLLMMVVMVLLSIELFILDQDGNVVEFVVEIFFRRVERFTVIVVVVVLDVVGDVLLELADVGVS